VALLDNFCWCSSFDEVRLHELKLAAKACYDVAMSYEAPYISGKDSMFNDFKGFDKKGPVAISVPPTLLGTAVAVMDDSTKATSIDLKVAGDIVYLLGETKPELGGSEFSQMLAERENIPYGGNVPEVSLETNKKLYKAYTEANTKGYIASAISVGRGGLAAALAKTAMAGQLGMDVDLSALPGTTKNLSDKLFSETQGRILVSVAQGKAKEFERSMRGVEMQKIGTVTAAATLVVRDGKAVSLPVAQLAKSYRSTFEGF
jgi:phosphoribosylformylglycinamidine synthase